MGFSSNDESSSLASSLPNLRVSSFFTIADVGAAFMSQTSRKDGISANASMQESLPLVDLKKLRYTTSQAQAQAHVSPLP